MVSDKTIHKAFRIHETLWIKTHERYFYFHYLPKLDFGFKWGCFSDAFSMYMNMETKLEVWKMPLSFLMSISIKLSTKVIFPAPLNLIMVII